MPSNAVNIVPKFHIKHCHLEHTTAENVLHIALGWLYSAPCAKNQSAQLCFIACDICLSLNHISEFFSVGFRSGDQTSSDRVPIFHALTDLALWHGALSCWESQSSELGNIVRAEESKFSSRRTCTWLDSCICHKQKSALFWPCWSTSLHRSLQILYQISHSGGKTLRHVQLSAQLSHYTIAGLIWEDDLYSSPLLFNP